MYEKGIRGRDGCKEIIRATMGRMNQFVGLHKFNIILLSGQFNCFKNILAQVKMVLTIILCFILLLFPFIHANPKLMKQNDPSANGEMELCPPIPSEINGKWMANKSIPTDWNELIQKYKMVEIGGIWKGPKECKARQRVALIIPYRERPEHLRALLNNLHLLLQKQQISYQIFVANQANPVNGIPDKFNRGKLINAAYAEIQRHFCMPPKGKKECWDCYIFHDVDLVPEDDRNLYRCGSEPIRLMSGTEEGQQNEYMGGVTAMSSEQFESVNGFSNNFWGWGSEDVNLRLRFDLTNQSITFLKGPIGEFTTLELVKKADDKTNPTIRTECREELNRKVAETWKFDGLSNLEYKMLDIVEEILYTNITIDLLMSLKGHPCGNEMFDWKSLHK